MASLVVAVALLNAAWAGADGIRYGVSSSATVTTSSVKRMARANIGVLRMPISYARVRDKRGELRWGSVDKAVLTASEHGVQVLPYLTGTPGWLRRCTRKRSCSRVVKSRNLTEDPMWDRFVTRAVDRYGRNGSVWVNRADPLPVECWQVWDMANRRGHKHPRVSADVYSRVLKSTYASIKVAEPTACVLTGSVELKSVKGPRRSSSSTYLRSILDSDAKYSFTALAVSPRAKKSSTALRQVRLIRDVLVRNGRSDAATWVAPIGWASDRSTSPTASVGLRGQSKQLRRVFAALTDSEDDLDVDGILWSAWRDGEPAVGCRWRRHSGLVRRNGHQKPALRAFIGFVKRHATDDIPSHDASSGSNDRPDFDDPTRGPRPSASYFGVAASDAMTDEDLAMMAEAGVGTARLVLHWPAVQPTGAGPYDWSRVDAEFKRLAQHGIAVLPQLLGDPTTVQSLISDLQPAWRSFVGAAVARYSPGGEFWRRLAKEDPYAAQVPPEAWEVWNEENATKFWRPTPSPEQYARLLLTSADAIRGSDPEAKVMVGGMYGYPKRSMHSAEFLERLYRIDGVKEAVDIVGLHPYSFDTEGVQRQFRETLTVMDAAGDTDATTWVTEISWGSDLSVGGAQGRTPEGQAEMLSASYGLMLQSRMAWRLQGIVWFSWRDPSPDGPACSWCYSAGLTRHDLTPKPAFHAFRDVASAWAQVLDG